MSQSLNPVANPFALLLDPEAVFRAIEKSERLERLHSRVCRPLDRPLLPTSDAAQESEAELREDPVPTDFGRAN